MKTDWRKYWPERDPEDCPDEPEPDLEWCDMCEGDWCAIHGNNLCDCDTISRHGNHECPRE